MYPAKAEATAPSTRERERLARANRALVEVERGFLLDEGLPNRKWFRHAFYAPGVYTGYSAIVLPGVRDAIDRKDWRGAVEQLRLAQKAIDRGTATLSRALADLN